MMDFVSYIYGALKQHGYRGVPISALYRDEVNALVFLERSYD